MYEAPECPIIFASLDDALFKLKGTVASPKTFKNIPITLEYYTRPPVPRLEEFKLSTGYCTFDKNVHYPGFFFFMEEGLEVNLVGRSFYCLG